MCDKLSLCDKLSSIAPHEKNDVVRDRIGKEELKNNTIMRYFGLKSRLMAQSSRKQRTIIIRKTQFQNENNSACNVRSTQIHVKDTVSNKHGLVT